MSAVRVELEAALEARYRIKGELGAGAAAVVYVAHDLKHDRRVALKVLRPEFAAVVGADRFLNEIRVTARLSHPNIIPLYDSGESEGYLYYTMPVIEGESLRQKLDREGRLSVGDAVAIARAVAAGLEYAHKHDVIHRDIKPENILLHQGVPLIADFGIAAAVDRLDVRRTAAAGLSPGTPTYMSPEVVAGQSYIGPETDVYSLATVLFEMLAGEPPFTGNTLALISRIAVEKPPKLRLLRSTVPPGLESAIERALEKAPAHRFGSAAAFSASLSLTESDARTAPESGRVSYLSALLAELKRRRVIRVAITYCGGALVTLGATQTLYEVLQLPDVFMRIVLALVVLGFPAALTLSWLFELTPQGRLRPEKVGFLPPLPGPVARRLATVGAGVALLAAVPFFVRWASDRMPHEDDDSTQPLRFVVMPLHFDGPADRAGDEDGLLYEALAGWSGISLAPLQPERLSRRRERSRAQALAADRYLRGSVVSMTARSQVNVELVDAHNGQVLAETRVSLRAGSDAAKSARTYTDSIAMLLFRGSGLRDPPPHAAIGTRSLPAAVAFLRGQDAISAWDLNMAGAQLARALSHDRNFARAALWQAYTQNWSGTVPAELQHLLHPADAAGLPRAENLLATGLLHLAAGEYHSACTVYEKLLREHPEQEFAAHFGLGECHRHDRLVVPDTLSSSGWRFRSSYYQGVTHYARAFALLANQSEFRTRTAQLARLVLLTTTNRRVVGSSENPRRSFAAVPELVADTLLLVPYPTGSSPLSDSSRVAAHSRAIEHQRTLFFSIASAWAKRYPGSPYALEGLALAQEMLGDERSVATLVRARKLAGNDPLQRQHLMTAEIMLLLKLGTPDRLAYLARARRLAAQQLRLARRDSSTAHPDLLVAAALAGNVEAAVELARSLAEGWERASYTIPEPIMRHAEALYVFVALGGPRDSILHLERELITAVNNRVPREERLDALSELLTRAATLAVPHQVLSSTAEIAEVSNFPLLRALSSYVSGDTAEARQRITAVRHTRRHLRPAQHVLDSAYPEAWLWAALHDTAAAVAVLDSVLTYVRWTEPGVFAQMQRASSLVWAMMLRAELAAARGQHREAIRWADAVVVLWQGADYSLQRHVTRMKYVADAARRRVRSP